MSTVLELALVPATSTAVACVRALPGHDLGPTDRWFVRALTPDTDADVREPVLARASASATALWVAADGPGAWRYALFEAGVRVDRFGPPVAPDDPEAVARLAALLDPARCARHVAQRLRAPSEDAAVATFSADVPPIVTLLRFVGVDLELTSTGPRLRR